MKTIGRTAFAHWLKCLGELPLGEGSHSQEAERDGDGSLLLSWRPTQKGAVYYCSIDLLDPLEGAASNPAPKVQLVSAADASVSYGKPTELRVSGQGRGFHCSILVREQPEGDVLFILLSAGD